MVEASSCAPTSGELRREYHERKEGTMQFVIRCVLRVALWPWRFVLRLANCCTGNVIACRGGHYGNLGSRGFREDQPVMSAYIF